MASIVERKNGSFSVAYYTTVNGKRKQIWETFSTCKEAKARKAEVENGINNGSFIPPSRQTIREFLADFVSLYGEEHWALSTYSSNIALIDNYINPFIGDAPIQSFNVQSADIYYRDLKKSKPVDNNGRKRKVVGNSVLLNVHKLLRCAFGQAVRWEIIGKNPFELVNKPKTSYKPREIWDAKTIRKALDECRDSKLYLAINLSFACSLRVGEILDLTWDNVHISEEEISSDNAHLIVEKELQRASQKAIDQLDQKDIIRIFPAIKVGAKTRLILKKPKTESSIRKIWMPRTLAYIMLEYKQWQDGMKRTLGDDYYDNDLVLSLPNGRPCEERVLAESFQRLKEKAGLPNVVFHSLRHSSTTYKLKLNKGDIKATQGDTGHAQADMVTKVYAHILDEDRKVNAMKMEKAFYGNQPNLHNVVPPKADGNNLTAEEIIRILEDTPPEKFALLADLIRSCTL